MGNWHTSKSEVGVFDVALSVVSCLRANTDVHVAWIVEPASVAGSAVAITPGGGRMGTLLAGALDHAVSEAAARLTHTGELVDIPLGPVEALVSGEPEGTRVTVAIVPGALLGSELWEDIAARRPVRFSLQRDQTRLTDPVRLEQAAAGIEMTETALITSLVPVPTVVVSAGGPIGEAVAAAFQALGWQATVASDLASATGMMATLSGQDAVVVIGHDVETSSRALQAGIESGAGYIGSVGGLRMQDLRREWLAYRGVEWDSRVHGPAGLLIGATTPAEIAVSIVAEALSALREPGRDPGGLR